MPAGGRWRLERPSLPPLPPLPPLVPVPPMIAGLSWSAWLLLVASVGLGLFIELLFYRNKRREAKRADLRPRDSE